MNVLIVILAMSLFIFALLFLRGVVALIEKYVPGASRWLDEHVGEPRAWE